MNNLACTFGSAQQTLTVLSINHGSALESLKKFHSEFLKQSASRMINKLTYGSLFCAYSWQEEFLMFSIENGHFVILASAKNTRAPLIA